MVTWVFLIKGIKYISNCTTLRGCLKSMIGSKKAYRGKVRLRVSFSSESVG